MGADMLKLTTIIASVALLGAASAANAKGVIKGDARGAAACHFVGHGHAKAGAVAGGLVGHHHAKMKGKAH